MYFIDNYNHFPIQSKEDIFKKIKDRHENLKRKENILIEKYGDEFKNKFYPKVASKLLNRKTQ